jgi:hypothetical protein
MRCVTRKPPKMLIEASSTASAPRTLVSEIGPSRSTVCKIAPTMMIPEIALVTDISGV